MWHMASANEHAEEEAARRARAAFTGMVALMVTVVLLATPGS